MTANMELVAKGMDILVRELGIIEAERFISIVIRERFDYTKWQRDHYDKIPDKELRQNMIEFCKAHPFKGKLIHDDE